MAGLNGLMPYSNPYEQGMSDVEKIFAKNELDKQQYEILQELALKKKLKEEKKKQPPKFLQKPTPNVNAAEALSNIKELFNKSNPKANDKEEPTGGNPNGNLDVDLSNINSKNGWGRLDGSDMQTDESSSDEKSSSGTKSSTPNVGNSAPKPTSGRTSPRRNTSRGEYADLENSGKTKEWYESLANSSYANDKKYEADMKAFRKMQADEIAKNGYYTDSQGVKVYAKAMTDKPKKESNNE